MSYDNNNTGTLGKNKRKEKDTQPGYKGKCLIDGKPYWISAWLRDGSDNEKFFSLSFTAKEAEPAPTRRQSEPRFSEVDSDIPF